MVCKETKDWMKTVPSNPEIPIAAGGKSLFDRWLLPNLGCNDGTKFAGRTVGNS